MKHEVLDGTINRSNKMAVNAFDFAVRFARRIPDPLFKEKYGLERHHFVMAVKDMPRNLPLDPNARNPNVRKRIYKGVEESLLNRSGEPGTFHLKNKGITIIADAVAESGKNVYRVSMKPGTHGIVDGGHTYKLIENNLDNPDLPDDQFVSVEVRVGVPDVWVTDIAGGLNTSVQVQDMSLDNLSGRFDWLREEIKKESYAEKIAWSENDPGNYDARDLISFLVLFNVALFPNDQDEHPVYGYEKKALALKAYEENQKSFESMRGLAKDIFSLHDIVSIEARDLYNKATKGKGGGLAFMEKRERGLFDFPFIKKQAEYRLTNGALYPILAAFRWFVVRDEFTGKLAWRDGFSEVLRAWRDLAPELVRATINTSNELGRNPNAVGKSRNHWSNLHGRVAKYDLLSRQQNPAE